MSRPINNIDDNVNKNQYIIEKDSLNRFVKYGEMLSFSDEISKDISSLQMQFNGLSVMNQLYMFILDSKITPEEKKDIDLYYKIIVDTHSNIGKNTIITESIVNDACSDAFHKGLPQELVSNLIRKQYVTH